MPELFFYMPSYVTKEENKFCFDFCYKINSVIDLVFSYIINPIVIDLSLVYFISSRSIRIIWYQSHG